MPIFAHPDYDHEEVHFFNDEDVGLKSIIAIHRTIAGATGGGCRFYPYEDEAQALTDVLLLSKAMTYKNVLAGLPMGGGKAVIIGDSFHDKTPQVLRAFAEKVESPAGRYVTACDVGTNENDMLLIKNTTQHVMGAKGYGGSTSPLTGYGVYQSILAAWKFHMNSDSLAGVKVAIQGYGGVGTYLAQYLKEAGAIITVADPCPDAQQQAAQLGAKTVHVDDILFEDVDIMAPCALGGVLTHQNIGRIKAKVICGGANNQLAGVSVAEALKKKGVTFVPDFVASAGGIIHGEGHLVGRSLEEIRTTVENIRNTTERVLRDAKVNNETPLAAAFALADDRMREASISKTQ